MVNNDKSILLLCQEIAIDNGYIIRDWNQNESGINWNKRQNSCTLRKAELWCTEVEIANINNT